MKTRTYLLQKIGQVVLTMFFILLFNFLLFRVMPGNPAVLLARAAGARLTKADQLQLIRDLGLDKPLIGQFFTYIGDTLRGNLGKSTIVYPGQSVMSIFSEFLRPTLILVGISLVLYAMPEWWLGILLLIFFAVTLGLFPTGGLVSVTQTYTGFGHFVDLLNHLSLPCLPLTLAYLGEYYLLMRSSLLDVLGEEYITLARAKGLREKLVLWRHAVRNALLPTVTLVALNFGYVLAGAITVETVYSYPGLGKLTFDALSAKDFPLLQGMFLFFSLAVIIANLIADLLYAYLDPRVREA